ncbi:unnamed protein product, partial [Urochloa humidicola]
SYIGELSWAAFVAPERTTYWIRTCAQLSKEEESKFLKNCCHKLEVVAMEVFSKFGWGRTKRLQGV